MNYRVLADAYEDISEIDDWVLEHYGAAFADRTEASFYETFELLTNIPAWASPARM